MLTMNAFMNNMFKLGVTQIRLQGIRGTQKMKKHLGDGARVLKHAGPRQNPSQERHGPHNNIKKYAVTNTDGTALLQTFEF
jgi:hypothetical protein